MSALIIHLPDDLMETLKNQTNVEQFIVTALRHELAEEENVVNALKEGYAQSESGDHHSVDEAFGQLEKLKAQWRMKQAKI
jgi:predicted transcriptional regulator